MISKTWTRVLIVVALVASVALFLDVYFYFKIQSERQERLVELCKSRNTDREVLASLVRGAIKQTKQVGLNPGALQRNLRKLRPLDCSHLSPGQTALPLLRMPKGVILQKPETPGHQLGGVAAEGAPTTPSDAV